MIAHTHLAELHKLYQSETQPFRKVHRMIDLFESIIKTHTAVIISEYVQHNNLSDTAKGLLSQGLRTPSLGTWQLFSRVLIKELEKEAISWKLPSFVDEFHDLDSALHKEKTNVIAFRNGYAHGATPTDEQCELDINKFDPFLTKLLNFQWLLDSRTIVEDDKVYLSSSDQLLSLHPILLYRDEKEAPSIAFFNDIKNDKVGLLNYPLGKHYREKNFLSEFHQYIPIDEWKKTGNNEFEQRVEQLTETFKGRTSERANLLGFVSTQTKGYLSIQGNPGIGKSALIAQFFKDLIGEKNLQNALIVEYFIRRGTPQAQSEFLINYLNKRTDDVFPPGKEIRAEGKMIFELQNQLFSKWRLWDQHANGRKLVFLIDGLDEGVENDILTYLPREVFENILFIYGSRSGGHKSVDDLWASLPVEHHTKLELSSLGKDDIRAMIYDVANKYELERESPWIDAVQKRSQGNPLYLKLLCNSIENGEIELNDIQRLPSTIDDYYKAIVLRYANNPDGDDLLNSLFTFAAAKDYLTFDHLKLINQLGTASIVRIGAILKEVLYENPLTEEIIDYQLFHESFREYLINIHSREINDATQRIIGFCETWNEHQGTWEQRYALEHYSNHLYQCNTERHNETLLRLMHDNEYTQSQKSVLRNYNSTNTLMRLCLLKSSEIKDFDKQLEAALSLVDLKYEEANSTHEIIDMIAAGEIELALNRIESFGGSDEGGLKSKFILYMLCLMELTLLDSKDKPFQKSAIERLLIHLDEQLPADSSILDWYKFFPNYLIFRMACEWAAFNLNFRVVYKRRFTRGYAWTLLDISIELRKRGQMEESASVMQEALAIARDEDENDEKSEALLDISIEMSKRGQMEESASVMQEALAIARGINIGYWKIRALLEISKQGQVEESALVLQEALIIARDINSNDTKSKALLAISIELRKQGQVEESASVMQEALAIADKLKNVPTNGIIDEESKIRIFLDISTELRKQGQIEESTSQMQEALAIARGIRGGTLNADYLSKFSIELSKQGQIEESLTIARGMRSGDWKSNTLLNISIELKKLDQVTESVSVMQEALAIARGISDEDGKSFALRDIAEELSKQNMLKETVSVVQETLAITPGITNEVFKSCVLKDISVELSKQGQVVKSLSIARAIRDDREKSRALLDIFKKLGKQGQVEESASVMQEALAIADKLKNVPTNGIIDEKSKIRIFLDISTELRKQGQVKESASLIQEALAIAHGIIAHRIIDQGLKSSALLEISMELEKLGRQVESVSVKQEALTNARAISDDFEKSRALLDISKELGKQGQVEESTSVMEEALSIARGINSDYWKIRILLDISTEMSKQGQVEKSVSVVQEMLFIARGISDDNDEKSSAWQNVARALSKQSQMDESLAILRSISNDWGTEYVLSEIAVEFGKQGNFQMAEAVGIEIPRIRKRQQTWEEMAETRVKIDGWQNALKQFEIFQSDEAKLFYLRGWTENLSTIDVNDICIQNALPIINKDNESIENLLQKYAINLMMGNPSLDLTDRLNRTLNIHWILDIIADLPQPDVSNRLSTNLDIWLHEISDEDDRDDIKNWAKKVEDGKMLEERFIEKLKNMI